MSRIAIIGIVGNSVFLPVDEFGVGGETVDAKSVHFELGGKGFNQAVAAARSGADVSFCAAVGSDLCDKVSDFLTGEGIDVCLAKKRCKFGICRNRYRLARSKSCYSLSGSSA